MMRAWFRAGFGILSILAAQGGGPVSTANAQQIRVAIAPDTILVGDVFWAALRVELPPGWTLTAPDSLAITGEVENAGRMNQTIRDRPDAGAEVTLAYPVTAWRAGAVNLPPVKILLNGPDGPEEVPASFPVVQVRSVLPADTAGVEPQPPKDVFGPNRLLWPYLVGALTLAAALAGLIYYRRRLMAKEPALTFDVAEIGSARERALAALDGLRAAGLVERGEVKEFYSASTGVLRAFLEEFDTTWGAELTSSELLHACRGGVAAADIDNLGQILDAADQVKFNRRQPAAVEAFAEWAAVRRWIDQFRLLSPVPPAPVSTTDTDTDTDAAEGPRAGPGDNSRSTGEAAP